MSVASRVDRECHDAPASIRTARKKVESKKNDSHQALFFFLGKVPTDSAPQAPSIKSVDKSPTGMAQVLFFFIFHFSKIHITFNILATFKCIV